MAPKNFEEFEKMLEFGINLNKPVAIRYPRGGEGKNIFKECKDIEIGKAEVVRQGKDISIIAIGKMVDKALQIAQKLEKDNIQAEVINARFLKPIDNQTILKSIEKTKKVITIEDGTVKVD